MVFKDFSFFKKNLSMKHSQKFFLVYINYLILKKKKTKLTTKLNEEVNSMFTSSQITNQENNALFFFKKNIYFFNFIF
jgi:hypothetical protein